MVFELDRAVGGNAGLDVLTEGLSDLQRILALDQTERDLGRSVRRDHRLGAFADVTSDDAVDVARRTRGNLLDQQALLFTGGDRQPDRLQEALWRQIELLPLIED